MFSSRTGVPLIIAGGLLLFAQASLAMVEMKDAQMSDVSGSGLAFVFDDFSMRQAPTSYIELTGSNNITSQAAANGWQRGDARYYGVSMTNGGALGTDWFASNSAGGGCNSGPAGAPNLRCSMGVGAANDYGITAFASIYDPFVLRVFQYSGYDYQGTMRNQPAGTGGANDMPTILEFRGPSNTDSWRWAFWGELEIGRTTTAGTFEVGTCNASGSSAAGCFGTQADFLQSQTIILGKPVAQGRVWKGMSGGVDQGYGAVNTRPAILRLMQTLDNSDQTLGVTYQSALSGDFRFSVRQTTASPDALHWVPDFQNQEGLYFRNVDAFLPLGALHYQALTFSGVSGYDANANPLATPVQNGNFSIELTRIPDLGNVYNNFYCGSTDGSVCAQASDNTIKDPNPDTHGYVRWGNWCTDSACSGVVDPYAGVSGTDAAYGVPNGTAQLNGMYFIGGDNGSGSPTNTAINIGISRIEGMLIQHMKITTLGAGT